MDNVPDVLTRSEAAQFLRVPPATLCYWATRRQGPRFAKLGKRTVYRKADLERFIDSCPAGGTPQQ